MPGRLSEFTLIAAALSVLAASAADAQGRRALRRLDADGDGKISQQEFIASRGAIFDRIDADHDGRMTKEEVAAFQARMETARAGAEIRSGRDRPEGAGPTRQLQHLMDLSANGALTRGQWDAAMAERFKRLDTGHTGFISMEQMRPGRRVEPTTETTSIMPAPTASPPK